MCVEVVKLARSYPPHIKRPLPKARHTEVVLKLNHE